MKPPTITPDPENETVLFWHIPKSGGTTLKSIYKCMKKTLSVRVGADPRYGHATDKEIVAFEPGRTGNSFVNVDTLTPPGILRAQELGLVPSGLADLVVTTNALNFAIEHLYDRSHKGRVLALFRHPVDRLVSKFYYSQIATWERSYHPQWKDIDILDWAEHINHDKNQLVKTLARVGEFGKVTETDLTVAVNTVKLRFIVGLMNEMEESIHRFNVFMGINESEEDNQICMDQFFGHGIKKENSNPHPKVEEGSPAWQVLARDNEFDIRLYESIVEIFGEQTEIIEEHARSAVWNGEE